MPYIRNADGVLVWEDSALLKTLKCENPEAHEAHMAVNGECPWCGETDPDSVISNLVICEAHGNPNCGLC